MQSIRSNRNYAKIPFIILSAAIDDNIRAKSMQIGVTDLIVKPFKRFELLKYVSYLVDVIKNSYNNSVLIVDDSKTTRLFIKNIMQNLHLKTFSTETAIEAENLLKRNQVDLIFLDNILPGICGIDWCRKLRNNKEFQLIPILGISSDKSVAVEFLQAGADDYINKPLIQDEVIVRTNNLLKHYNLNKQLDISVQKERALNKQKNQLLGMAAHDLRNQIGTILNYSQIVIDGWADDDFNREAMPNINNLAKDSINLLNDILDVSSIESGVIELKRDHFSMIELLQDRLSLMNEIGKAKNIKGSLINELDVNDLFSLNADRNRVSQIVDNLLSNAVKYSPPNSQYEIYLKKHTDGLLIEIADHGQGIHEDEIGIVFDEFKTTSTKTTGGEKSTGLGLAIVKKLINLHYGKISVKSKLGEGSTFSFHLPYE